VIDGYTVPEEERCPYAKNKGFKNNKNPTHPFLIYKSKIKSIPDNYS
jgi:hypothetical protein